MNELSKLLENLKKRYPDKIPTNLTVTERDISFLQGQQVIIRDIELYINKKIEESKR